VSRRRELVIFSGLAAASRRLLKSTSQSTGHGEFSPVTSPRLRGASKDVKPKLAFHNASQVLSTRRLAQHNSQFAAAASFEWRLGSETRFEGSRPWPETLPKIKNAGLPASLRLERSELRSRIFGPL
jgi:hypothetical protein